MKEIFFSMDVEDWFHCENLKPYLPPSIPSHSSLYVLDMIIDLLSKQEAKGTFFFLGETAKKYPSWVKKLSEKGHEIASHGWSHELFDNLGKEQTLIELKKSKDLLEDQTGNEILGFRSACFSQNEWIEETLIELGFKYTSMGIEASFHDRYVSNSYLDNPLPDLEMPIVKIAGLKIPATGGGWFRLFPHLLQKILMNLSDQKDIIFYCHPWDFDPLKPTMKNMPFLSKLRHSINAKSSMDKLTKFNFSSKTLSQLVL